MTLYTDIDRRRDEIMSVLPAPALDQHVAVLGKTGSGKTYAAKGIVEGLLEDGRHVCILDPTGAWWGLRIGKDGKGPGHELIIVGGAHGDLPLSDRSGAAVARLVTQQHARVIIDTSAMLVGEYTRFFIDFAGTLYTTISDPLHLVIDEAHHFMPQGKVADPQAGRMLHAGNRLMSGGRSKGIRGMLITQRPAKLHKDSLTCADTLIAMRMIAPQDRAAVREWIDGAGDPKVGREVLDSLAGLDRGEGWVWYPEGGFLQRVRFPKIKTFDSSATPEHGAGAAPEPVAIDLDEVRAAMAEAVAQAEANDPKLLRARIAELERQAKASPAKPAPAVDVASIERRVRSEIAGSLAPHAAVAGRFLEGLHAWGINLVRDIEEPRAALASIAGVGTIARNGTHPEHKPATSPPPQPRPARERAVASSEGDLPQGERAILEACVQFGGCGRDQLAVLTGYRRSTRNTYIQRLAVKGLVVVDGAIVRATPEGEALIPEVGPVPTGEALREFWRARLPEGERRIFEELVAAGGEADREHLGERTEYSRSTRNTYLQRLGARRVVENAGRGRVRLAGGMRP